MRLLIPAVLVSLLLLSCSGSIPRVSANHVLVAKERWLAVRLEDLSAGRALYVSRCSGCHGLYVPDRYSPTEWADIVRAMGDRAKLDNRQVLEVIQYLSAVTAKDRGDSAAVVTAPH